MPRPSLLALCYASSVAAARLLHSVPEDPFAFPKYRVTFLNGLPVLNETAEQWLQDGLRGGELEFLDQPWQEESWDPPPSRKEIGTGDREEDVTTEASASHASPYKLEKMKMGPNNGYLCLIPPPPDTPADATAEGDQAAEEVTPAHSWSLLQPLAGTCLFHRQPWFTYSYCHNSHVRQFREMAHAHPHPPGGYVPEEDPEWEAYTLGRAPTSAQPGAELTVAEQNALAANLDIAGGAGARYLVQRWRDGTVCDKTGRKREIEIQFHCSMTMTDTILFVKETKLCHYVLVVHTPRLCGEPGFQTRLAVHEAAHIRCREIVATTEGTNPSLPEADHPFKLPRRTERVLPAPPAAPPAKPAAGKAVGQDALKWALEKLMGKGAIGDGDVVVEQLEDGEFVVQFLEPGELHEGAEGYGYLQGDEAAGTAETEDDYDALFEILRAAGLDLRDVYPAEEEKLKAKKRQAQMQMEPQEDEEPELLGHRLDEL